MKLTNKSLTIYITLLFLSFSCTEEIDIKLDKCYDRVVIFGELTTDLKTHYVMVSKSTDYYNPNGMPGISNAEVTLSGDNNTIELFENDSVAGKYETPGDFAGIVGKSYKLSVKNVDIDNNGLYEIYEATSEILPAVVIDSIQLKYWPIFEAVTIKLWGTDNADTENFYLMKARKNGVLITDTLSEWSITDDELFNGRNTSGIDVILLYQDIEEKVIRPGDIVELEVSNISKEYYHFIEECMIASDFQIPLFSKTPANVKGNISNGAIGFFAAYNISRKSIVATPFKQQ